MDNKGLGKTRKWCGVLSEVVREAVLRSLPFTEGLLDSCQIFNGTYSNQLPGKYDKKESNGDCIQELSKKDQKQEEGQCHSGEEEEKESDMSEDTNGYLDEKEQEIYSAVMYMQTAYDLVHEVRKTIDGLASGDDKWADIEK